jgi:hypothetical protein
VSSAEHVDVDSAVPGFTTTTVHGSDTLDRLGGDIDELHDAVALPVSARRPWLRAWTAAFPEYQPFAVLVRENGDDRIEGAALLAVADRDGTAEVVNIGHSRNDRSYFPARSPAGAEALGCAVADVLQSLPTAWTFRVEQLPVGSVAVKTLAQQLPSAHLKPGGGIPRVVFDGTRDVDGYLTKNLRKQLRKAKNRMDDDGIVSVTAFERDPARLQVLLDGVEEIHRARDHDVGRRSDIDSLSGLTLWRSIISVHANAGQVEIATLTLDGMLAAYVVSLLDYPSYRVLDGRFATSWSRYSPGRLLETLALDHAAADGRFTDLDWMNSVAPEKVVACNTIEATETLSAAGAPIDLRPGASVDVAER